MHYVTSLFATTNIIIKMFPSNESLVDFMLKNKNEHNSKNNILNFQIQNGLSNIKKKNRQPRQP